MKRNYFLFIIITTLTFILSFSLCTQAFTVRIDSPKVKLTVAPGSSKTGKINVENISNKSINVKAYLNDWAYNKEGKGTKDFFPPASTKFSCAEWIYFYPEEFKLDPYETRNISYTVNAPPASKGGYYAVLFFESLLGEAKTEEGVGVNIAGRIASLFYVDVEGTVNRSGQIKNLSLSRPDDDKPLRISFAFKNTGNADIAAKGTFNIINNKGEIFGRGQIPDIYAFVDDEFETETEWAGKLNEGIYDFVMTLDIGSETPLVEEERIEVIEEANIEDFKATNIDSNYTFNVKVKNTGNIKVGITSGTIKIFDGNKNTVDAKDINKEVILPNTTSEVNVSLDKKLPPGTYIASLNLTLNEKRLSKELGFSVR